MIEHGSNGFLAAAEILVDGKRNHLPIEQIPLRGDDLPDGVVPVGDAAETHDAVLIGNSGIHPVAEFIAQGKFSACQGIAVLINLFHQHGIFSVHDGRQGQGRIHEGSVHGYFHGRAVCHIAGQGTGFHYSVGAVRDFLKSNDALFIRYGGKQNVVVFIG